MYEDVKCPYCGHPQNIDHDDGYGYNDYEIFNQYCNGCRKTFVYTTSTVFYYDVHKADCLNEGEHKWKLTETFPKCFSKMECQDCGESRNLTEEEHIKFNIPTQEDYFKELKNEINE